MRRGLEIKFRCVSKDYKTVRSLVCRNAKEALSHILTIILQICAGWSCIKVEQVSDDGHLSSSMKQHVQKTNVFHVFVPPGGVPVQQKHLDPPCKNKLSDRKCCVVQR